MADETAPPPAAPDTITSPVTGKRPQGWNLRRENRPPPKPKPPKIAKPRKPPPNQAKPFVVTDELKAMQKEAGIKVRVGLPTPEECLEVYKRLGPARSMANVRRWFLQNKRVPPGHTTLKKWSAEHKWTVVCTEWDQQVARIADEKIKEQQAMDQAADMGNLAKYMRLVSLKGLKKLSNKIDSLDLKTGGEMKAVADACVALNKAAEVLTGGVSDRTERVASTAAERKEAAESLVDQAFANFSAGNDNGRAAGKHHEGNQYTRRAEAEQRRLDAEQEQVGNAGNAGEGASGVQEDPGVGGNAAGHSSERGVA